MLLCVAETKNVSFQDIKHYFVDRIEQYGYNLLYEEQREQNRGRVRRKALVFV